MKLKILYTLFGSLLGLFLFYGNASGPASVQGNDRTGSPLSPGFCGAAGCHGGGNFDPSVSIRLLDGENAITEYTPEQTYTLSIEITAGTGTPGGFGFQAVALSGETDVNAGSFGEKPDGTNIVALNDRNYWEHSSSSASGSFTIDWTAPAAGTGTVTIYAAGNAVNGNSGTSGDSPLAVNAAFEESATSSTRNQPLAVDINLYPNPVAETLILELQTQENDDYELQILNILGQVVQKEQIGLVAGLNSYSLPVSHLHKGSYFLQLTDGKRTATKRIIKL